MLRLWRGEVPLVMTYWIFGVVIGWAVVAAALVFQTFFALTNLWLTLVVSWLPLAYLLFVFVAIWRSAGRYEGLRIQISRARRGAVEADQHGMGSVSRIRHP